MGNIGKVIVDTITNVVESLKKKLADVYGGKANAIISRLNTAIEILRSIKPPLLLTRKFVDSTNSLIKYVLKLRNLVDDYINGKILEEDLYKAVQECEEVIKTYSLVVSRERLKTQLYLLLPQLIVLMTIIYQVYVVRLPIPSPHMELILSLILASVVVLNYTVILSHVLVAISIIIIMDVMLSIGLSMGIISLIIASLYLIALLTSLSYIHISYVISSKKQISKIEKMLKNILTHSKPERIEAKKPVIDIKHMEDKLKEIYRKIYGNIGEDYLKYRLTLLVITRGLSREEALKRLLEEVKDLNV